MTKILIFIIKIYQYLISPLLGNRCRFLPSCSEYFIEALKTQGLTKGIKLGLKRNNQNYWTDSETKILKKFLGQLMMII